MPSQENKITNPRCKHFHECGGCNFLDLSEEDYRKKKQETLQHYNGDINWVWVSEHSRRKITLQIGKSNEIGFFANKSKNIVEIQSCLIAEKEISQIILPLKALLNSQTRNLFTQITVTLFDGGLDLVLHSKKDLDFHQTQKLLNFGKENNLNISYRVKNQIAPVCLVRKNQIFYPKFKINLNSDIFIQATKSGLNTIVAIIRKHLTNHPNLDKGLSVADIYSGYGAYSFAIVDLIKSITAFEGDEKMVELASKNIAENNLGIKINSELCDLFLSPIRKKALSKFDVAIINPPRNGAAPQIAELSKSEIKDIIYVSCNPISFFNDAKVLIDSGFKITNLTALDQFYSTKHLELIAIFQK